MATATKSGKKLVVKDRAKSLKKLDAPPANFAMPALASAHPKDVHSWSESILDGLEEKGQTLSPKGWVALVKQEVPDAETGKAIVASLKTIYAKPAGGDGASTPAAGKKPAATAKGAAKNGNGKKKAAAKKGATAAAPRAEMVDVSFTNKTKIPVTWVRAKESGRNIVNIFDDIAPRAFCRALGKKGWDNETALNLLLRMGLENYHKDMKAHVVGAHMAAGRNKDEEMYGPIPVLTKEQWAVVEQYNKK